MLSAAHMERCTFDCQFLCFVLVFSVLLHGKHPFRIIMYHISNEFIVAQILRIGKKIFHLRKYF